MAAIQDCFFPILDGSPKSVTDWQSTGASLHHAVDLCSFAERLDLSPVSVLEMAWAVVLRCYVGSNLLSFGCIDRAKATDGSNGMNTIGELPHLKACYVDLENENTIFNTLKKISGCSITRGCLLDQFLLTKFIKSDTAIVSAFNTALIYQNSKDETSMHTAKSSIMTGIRVSKVS